MKFKNFELRFGVHRKALVSLKQPLADIGFAFSRKTRSFYIVCWCTKKVDRGV